ncbi:MAG: DUF3604 domain-containing protein [Gammaproteobacteria bacterium]|nr:DUF3604 domain-containing protein [Gammaproteobacteria bacterium]
MRIWIVCLASLFTLPSAVAQDFGGIENADDNFQGRSYSPYADRNFPDRPLWGDTHLHTALSFDAGAFGNRLVPEDAYRFAKGEEVTSTGGYKVRLSRPLDWLVVSDHSDNMGLFTRIYDGHPDILADPEGRRIYNMIKAGGQNAVQAAAELIDAFSRGIKVSDALAVEPGTPAFRSTWEHIVNAAEDANDPGRFTAFIGYEWTSLDNGDNLHRVVIYRDGANKALQIEPYTTAEPFGSTDPRDLWDWLANYEQFTGGQILALAHNGNLSNGVMFPVENQFTGRKLNRSYVEQRARWEPLYEVTQIKGDGEAHPFLSPDDEFADYENWDRANLNASVMKEDSMLEFEYARSALRNGLVLEQKFGVNPYKFGMVGSTDSHTSLATAAEENFFGKHSGTEPEPDRMKHVVAQFGDFRLEAWEMVASGLAAVWARENTRESIFEAMMRKEVYATTGSRILVRFFGGWDFVEKDALSRLPAELGYMKGVPMGGDLSAAPEGQAPNFLVAAMKDPLSGNLDRIQIIKGWLDAEGNTQEKVYDVVWSDMDLRERDKKGRVPLVGNTVNIPAATWLNTIGDPELITVWRDPDFDPTVPAFYYARVIEIPTPRWTAYDKQRYALSGVDKEIPMTTQERAYTSPIWYTPGENDDE